MSRDLRESPFPLELDLSAIPDGAYVLAATVVDGESPVTTAQLGISLHKGLDARLRALDAGSSDVPEPVRNSIRYPGDFIRNINRGRTRIGNFDVARELALAEGLLATARTGKDPFADRTGDMERHHLLPGAGEIMPYRVYVAKGYAGAAPAPLVIALHGLGGNEDLFFEAYNGLAPVLAEKHGFLMAAPLGYRVDGFYGAALGGTSGTAARRRVTLSEQDVLGVLRQMRAHYRVDDSRVYLIGHSMGAIGAWHLGSKYPDTWAALGLFSGMGTAALAADTLKTIPQIVVHGDADPTVNVEGSRTMVARLKEAGTNVTYIEVPGGSHTDVVVPNMPKVFEFLAAQRKK